MRRVLHSRTLSFFAIVVTSSGLGVVGCHGGPPDSSVILADATPVSGSSLLLRLGLTVDTSALGQVGGMGNAPPTARREPMPRIPSESGWIAATLRRLWPVDRPSRAVPRPAETFVLTGTDLYRLNCQACHGADGVGKPPEITSLLDPVRGTSARLLSQRLESLGRPVDEAFIHEIVDGAKGDLLQRLTDGGKEMPPFKRLRHDETQSLLAYLDRLAGVPEAPTEPALVTESVVRVGEQLVKSTCQICHDATGGPRGRMAVMMSGSAPSLESVAHDYSADEMIAKVQNGSSGRMGMMMMRPSKMPRLPYLTREEITAAVAYLRAYPPQP